MQDPKHMQGLLIGRRMDGRDFYLPPVSRLEHALIGGKTGTGKSGLTAAIAAELARCPDVALIGIDLKLMELALWRPRLTALANTADEASLLLALVVAEIVRRNQLLESLGLRYWDPRHGPWIVLFVDELARLAGIAVEHLLDQANASTETDPTTGRPVKLDTNLARQAKDALAVRMALIDWIVAVGRAAGIRLIAATQYPTADVIDSNIRSQFGLRFMLRVISREQVAVILGAGNEQHIQPDSIPVTERGGFWCVGNPGDPRATRGRAFMFNDTTLTNRFRSTSHLRIDQTQVFKADPTPHLHAVPTRKGQPQ
ncbi:MAG: FtsK/SpoIIIE domain-containing protein [Acidimicrobiales bacterium]